ncbi:hypothetical protein BJ508DRAFT_301709 [Ascobolus immersus RN42]|uniref:MADS-box domain-containing protein n=1 Tax=Ascobolus immersus RN42 TaxID=1160509 RepID=A0A3N4IMH7_ASCIM|nr:hypothetical protein BJ508DRAFT_301709 [Ascobolus immersus RN42]
MGRRKIAIEPITEERNRSVTFLKRKAGLFKKAHELSVLCSVEVAVIVYGSNRRLYEYCSSDMHSMLSRYTSFEQPHEHRGPEDYRKGKGRDESESPSPGPEIDHGMPPHLQHLPAHLNSQRNTASESPPVQNRSIYGPGPAGGRMTPPNPHSRRQSHDTSRRGSSLAPPNLQQPQPPAPPNGFYVPLQYNGPPPPGINQPPMGQNYYPSQPTQMQQPSFIDRRPSMPSTFRQEQNSGPQPPPQPPKIETDMPQPPQIEKRPPVKSRSMFTPIGPSESVLAQHWSFAHQSESRSNSLEIPRPANVPKESPLKSETKDSPGASTSAGSPPATGGPPPAPIISERTVPIIPPPAPGKRPRLKVQIPIGEQAEGDEVSGSASPRTTTASTAQPATSKPPTENNHAGTVVLPPPSPSVTLVSAGHTGPANPFARPPPTTGPGDTPMSALPSRFTEALLPSPSSFFSTEWFGKGGDGMLPSPSTFQTPIGTHSNFKDMFKSVVTAPDENGKRKSDEAEGGGGKKLKA